MTSTYGQVQNVSCKQLDKNQVKQGNFDAKKLSSELYEIMIHKIQNTQNLYKRFKSTTLCDDYSLV